MTVDEMEKKFYLSRPDWCDGTSEFWRMIEGRPSLATARALEIGPGPENRSSAHIASRVAYLDGLDIDERIRENTALRRRMIYPGSEFPREIEEESYELVVADYVLEHVENPRLLLGEVRRILCPGGWFVFRTPNVFHYVALVSKLAPHWVHLRLANPARGRGVESGDPYPTYYRLNSRRAVILGSRRSGLGLRELRMVEKQPSYLRFHPIAYACGTALERCLNRFGVLAGLRANLFCVLTKPVDP